MDDGRSLAFVVGSTGAAALVVVGSWLPWIRKIPAGYTNGQPYYTAEWVLGLEAGFRTFDILLALVGLLAVVFTVVAEYHDRRLGALVGGAGLLVLLLAGNYVLASRGRYIFEPGLYMIGLGGALLAIIGCAMFVRRRSTDGAWVGSLSRRR